MHTALLIVSLVAAALAAGANNAAMVRVVHAAPTTPAVDVYVNNALVLGAVPYGAVSEYLLLPAGKYFIDVQVSGAPNVSIINQTVAVAAGYPYTVAAVGIAPFNGLSTFTDTLTAPPFGSALVRFVHFSPNAPAVNVLLNQQKLFSKVTYKTVTPYITVSTNFSPLNLLVLQVPGTTTEFTLTNFNPQPGMAYTVFAEGFVGGSGSQALQGIVAVDV